MASKFTITQFEVATSVPGPIAGSGTAGADLGERWPSLVAAAAEDHFERAQLIRGGDWANPTRGPMRSAEN